MNKIRGKKTEISTPEHGDVRSLFQTCQWGGPSFPGAEPKEGMGCDSLATHRRYDADLAEWLLVCAQCASTSIENEMAMCACCDIKHTIKDMDTVKEVMETIREIGELPEFIHNTLRKNAEPKEALHVLATSVAFVLGGSDQTLEGFIAILRSIVPRAEQAHAQMVMEVEVKDKSVKRAQN